MAVRNVSLQIERGSIYGLLGPNGAGKSTSLKMLVGLLRPTGGRIILDGRPWQKESLSKIGSLIESPALYGNLTAEENLLVHTRLLKIPKTKITEVLETVNLKNTGKKRVSQFSMGMKQRLGIAAALLNDPELLILDEPTNGLDPFGIQELRELIISFSEKGMMCIRDSPSVAFRTAIRMVQTFYSLHKKLLRLLILTIFHHTDAQIPYEHTLLLQMVAGAVFHKLHTGLDHLTHIRVLPCQVPIQNELQVIIENVVPIRDLLCQFKAFLLSLIHISSGNSLRW